MSRAGTSLGVWASRAASLTSLGAVADVMDDGDEAFDVCGFEESVGAFGGDVGVGRLVKASRLDGPAGGKVVDAVEVDRLSATPFRKVRIGTAPSRADVPLPEPEMLATAIAALPDNVRPAVVLGVATGLRASELCGLRVEDVDFLRGVVKVRRQLLLTAGGGVDDNAPTKTPSSVRDVPVDQGIVDMLAAHLVGRDVSPAAPLFLTQAGTPLHRKRLSEAWFNARTEVGVGKVNFHDLRAYAITELIDSGATLKSVSKLAGHTKVTMTSDVYRRSRESDDAAIRKGQAGLLAAITKARESGAVETG
jgi:integrase